MFVVTQTCPKLLPIYLSFLINSMQCPPFAIAPTGPQSPFKSNLTIVTVASNERQCCPSAATIMLSLLPTMPLKPSAPCTFTITFILCHHCHVINLVLPSLASLNSHMYQASSIISVCHRPSPG